MEDRRHAELISWDPDPVRPSIVGRHHGYAALAQPATHSRRIELDTDGRALVITDIVTSDAEHDLEWTFPLAPCAAHADRDRAAASFDSGVALAVDAAGAQFRIDDGWLSPSYGRRVRTPFLRATARSSRGEHVTRFVLRLIERPYPVTA